MGRAVIDLTNLTSFIPLDRRKALASGKPLPDHANGTVLFADVSGFTRLTGVLMQAMGPNRGAEELLNILNPVFKSLIEKVHHFGGAVTGFAGDSILCWLDEDDGTRAIACAMAMQKSMGPFRQRPSEHGDSNLFLKTVIAGGRTRRWIIGLGDAGLFDVLAGEPVEKAAALERSANSGETLVEASILHRLGELVRVDEWRQIEDGLTAGVVGVMNGEVSPIPLAEEADVVLTDNQVWPWLLKPVYERMRAEQAYLAELRPVAALFLRFRGLDYNGDHDAGRKLDDYIKWVQGVLLNHHGYLIQLTVGDKGSFFYATFGAPVTRGNNALLATAAAAELQSGSGDFPGIEHIQIGISCGHMWTGAYGGPARRTYGAIGNETNVAARLMVEAKTGQVLATKRIVDEAIAHYAFHDLGTLVVRGFDKPIPVWEVRGRKPFSGGEAKPSMQPLIGRQEPFAKMQRLLRKSREGNGQIIDLTGNAGVGKSHLVAHFLRWAKTQGFEPFVGDCQSVGQKLVYLPWRAIFSSLLGFDTQDVSITNLSKAVKRLNPDWFFRLPILGDLLALPIEDNPTTVGLDAVMRQKALFSLVVEIIRFKCQERPLLLVIDNGQWMDEASQAMFETVARQAIRGSAVTLLLSRRPSADPPSPISSIAGSVPFVTEINLEGLSRGNLVKLVELGLRGQPSRLFVDLLHKMTMGNPLFVGKLSESMVQAGQLVQEEDGTWQVSGKLLGELHAAGYLARVDGSWILKDGVDLSTVQLGIPLSLHELVLSRLDYLPEGSRLTLKTGSVIGDRFDHYFLAQVHPQGHNPAQIRADIELLEAEDIVYFVDPSKRTVAFRHHTIHDVVYNTLLHTQRQHLHQRIALALKKAQPDSVTQIAQHAYLGQSWPLALDYCVLAGQESEKLHANKQSLDFYEKALTSARELPEADTLAERKISHLAIGGLLVSAGEYPAGREHLGKALDLANTLDDKECQACAFRWLGRSYELQGEYDKALSWLEKGLTVLEGMDSVEEAELSLIAGLIEVRQGNYVEAELLCQRSLHVANELEDLAVEARTYNLLGIVDRRRGNSSSAVKGFRRALKIYGRLANVYGEATSHNLIATCEIARGNWKEAEHHYRRSLDQFTLIGDIYNQVLVNSNLGGIALRQGQLEQATNHYSQAITLLDQIGGSLWVFGALHMNAANALLQESDLEGAKEKLLLAQELFAQAKSRDLVPELLGLFAEAALREGDLDEAEQYGRQAIEIAREMKMRREEGHNLRVIGEIAHAQSRLLEAEQYLRESYVILDDIGDAYEKAKTQLSLAGLQMTTGEMEAAGKELAICEETFTKLGAELDLRRVAECKRFLDRHLETADHPE